MSGLFFVLWHIFKNSNLIQKHWIGTEVVKWKNKIYLLAFISGIVAMNIFGTEVSNGMLNRYSLAAMTFGQIVYEEYFLYILFLRLQTVLSLWIFSKFVPSKWVMLLFACIICSLMGGIMALCMIENGLWGMIFYGVAFLPHGICYGMAYVLWNNMYCVNMQMKNTREQYVRMAVMVLLIGVGCVVEAYVVPVLVKNIVKY